MNQGLARLMRLVAGVSVVGGLLLFQPVSSLAYEFGDSVQRTGATETVFDWDGYAAEDWGQPDPGPAEANAVACVNNPPPPPAPQVPSPQPANHPDQPVKAFRDSLNRTQINIASRVSRRLVSGVGGGLADVARPPNGCGQPGITHWSFAAHKNSQSPAYDGYGNWYDLDRFYDNHEWVTSPYAVEDGSPGENGTLLYALLHNECSMGPSGVSSPELNCNQDDSLWVSVTVTTSNNPADPGKQFVDPFPPPDQLVAALPYRYPSTEQEWTDMGVPGRNLGPASPSNILRTERVPGEGAYYYAMLLMRGLNEQQSGACLMRTQQLFDAQGEAATVDDWEFWDGDGFTGNRFIDPNVRHLGEPANKHLCQPVSADRVVTAMRATLHYNTYFEKYMVSGWVRSDQTEDGEVEGIYYSLSDDLVNWGPRRLLMKARVGTTLGAPGEDRCQEAQDPENWPTVYSSILDESDPAATGGPNGPRNYDHPGRTPYLYFTRSVPPTTNGCTAAHANRDLVRIPFKFNQQPEASFSAPSTVSAGEQFVLNAAGSSDGDGSIANYEWDLDGDGTYETSSPNGSFILKTFSLKQLGRVTVRLRVTDNDGTASEVFSRAVVVDGKINFQPSGSEVPAGYLADNGGAFSGTPGNPDQGYGWVQRATLGLPNNQHVPVDLAGNTRESNVAGTDQRLDTFIYPELPPGELQGNPIPGALEVSVPLGIYEVTVSAGDTAFMAGQEGLQRVNVEGSTALNFVPTDSERSRSATIAVVVTDGRLTVDTTGGFRTKLQYMNISMQNAPPIARLSVSSAQFPPAVGQAIGLDASASEDPEAFPGIAKYEWDLDGDGEFERDSGTDSVVGMTLRRVGQVVPRVRITDINGTSAVMGATLNVGARINFQPEGAEVPSGYKRDVGAAFEEARGFGWVTEVTHAPLGLLPNPRDRDVDSDQRKDSFVYMQYPASEPANAGEATRGAWEIAVPNGTYRVGVSVGDALGTGGSSPSIRLEGTQVISGFDPGSNWGTSQSQVISVSDGKLTVDAIGGTNTKLNYVDIELQ